MSSILKALRKLEEEKRGGKLEAPDLRVDQGQSVAVGKSFLPLVVGVVLGALIVGLLFFWPSASKDRLHATRNEPPTAISPAAVSPVASPQTAAYPPSEAAEDQQLPNASAKPEASVASTVSEPAVRQTVRVSPVPAQTAEPVSPVKAVEKRLARPAPATLPDGINLVVTEIFYQDAVNSMAVVNDLPVMVGSHVDSAVVTEIRTDQVFFEIDGEVFSVPAIQ